MATKMYTVRKGSETEEGIRRLIRKGILGLWNFEKQLDVLHFCWDMEVIVDTRGKQYLLMLSGSARGIEQYENTDLVEMTREELHTTLPEGQVVLFAGTQELIEEAGYQLTKRRGNFHEIKLVP